MKTLKDYLDQYGIEKIFEYIESLEEDATAEYNIDLESLRRNFFES